MQFFVVSFEEYFKPTWNNDAKLYLTNQNIATRCYFFRLNSVDYSVDSKNSKMLWETFFKESLSEISFEENDS